MMSSTKAISQIDDDFNPMADDFNDLKFNSYKSGPGSFISPHLHTQNRWKDSGQFYKLHVTNIPIAINDYGFQNIFSNFGSPFNMCLCISKKNNNTKWGFVNYKTLREAERAIYCVNRIPPLNLSVKFAMTDEAKENRIKFSDIDESALDDLTQFKADTSHKGVSSGRGRGLPLPQLEGLRPSSIPSNYIWYQPHLSAYSEPLLSHPTGEFCYYYGDEIIDLYNEALNYYKPVLKNNSKYLVYMGRGYAFKNTIHHSERYTVAEEEVFSFSSEDAKTVYECQQCCCCKNEAMRICFNCSQWYCSKACFRADSPRHVIHTSGLVICYNLQNDQQAAKGHNKNTNSSRGIFVKKLFFPPLNEGSKESLNKSQPSLSDSLQNVHDNKFIENRNALVNQTHFIRSVDTMEKFDSGSGIVSRGSSFRMNLSGSNLALPEHCPLSAGDFTQVKICAHDREFSYWVSKVSDHDKFVDVTKKLYKFCKSTKSASLQSVVPSSLCAAFSDGFWYRAKIISIIDDNVRIRLIDCGREEKCLNKNLKILPQDFAGEPSLAFKIRFAKGTPSKYKDLSDENSDQINVKPISMDDDGSVIVHADNVLYTSAESEASLDKESSIRITDTDGPLSYNSFSDVVIAYRCRESEYWVNLLSTWNDLNDMSSILNMIGDRSNKVQTPSLGETYIKLFENYWCRARVTCLEPLTVFYIDYGNEEKVSHVRDLHSLPPMLTHRFPPMAVKIRLAEGTSELYSNLKETDRLRVKAVSKDGETYIVLVEGEDYSDSGSSSSLDRSSKNPTQFEGSINHLLYGLEGCKRFDIIVNQVMSKNRFCGSLHFNSHQSILKTVEEELCSLDYSFNDNIKLGDRVVCLTREGVCARGYLLSVIEETKRVALIDYAYVTAVDKMCLLPQSLLDVPEVGVSCSVISPLNDIQEGTKVRCIKARRMGNKVHCEAEGYGKLILSLWSPRVEDGGLSCVIIPSGSRIVISSYRTPQAIYVQSLESKQRELYETLSQDVAAYSSTALPLNRDPEIGEIILCLFSEDQNFYRAQVYRKKGNQFSVIFIDFGNSFDVSSNEMRVLNDSLKMVPCCAVKIGLKGVNESILTGDCVNYLNSKCVHDNSPLFLEYDESLKHSVLKTENGEVINDKVNGMIGSHWKKCLEEEKDPTNGLVFFGDEITYIKWDANSKVKLLIVSRISVNCYFVINTEDGLLDFVRDWFTPRVSEYCNSFAKHYSYNPRLREICLVKLEEDNQWYRAIVTNTFDLSCWVIFIDFGNIGEVYFKNVRPMINEFIKIPSILKKCFIQGLTNEYPSDNAEKKLTEILCKGSIHDTTIIKESRYGVVHANFKKISDVAQEIGLPLIETPES